MMILRLFRTLAFVTLLSLSAWAVSLEEIDALLSRHQLDKVEAHLTELMKTRPDDAQLLQRWGFLLLLKSQTVTDAGQAKALRKASRDAFVRSKALGNTDPLVATMLASIPPDGGDGDRFSENPQAEKEMKAGEAHFAAARWAEAAAHYEQAQKLIRRSTLRRSISAMRYSSKARFRLPARPTSKRRNSIPIKRRLTAIGATLSCDREP